MIGYTMKNSKGEYLAMDGGSTTDWFKASKFDKSGIKSREMYLDCGYKLIKFEIKEHQHVLSLCGNYCDAELTVNISQEGLKSECSYCGEVVFLVSD